jgi:hypothetical protein
MLWTKLTTGKKLILSQNSPETPEALNFLKELVEAGKKKVVIDRCFLRASLLHPSGFPIMFHSYYDISLLVSFLYIPMGLN